MAVVHERTAGASTIHVFHVLSSFLWTDTRTLSVSSEEIRRFSQMGRKEINKEKNV